MNYLLIRNLPLQPDLIRKRILEENGKSQENFFERFKHYAELKSAKITYVTYRNILLSLGSLKEFSVNTNQKIDEYRLTKPVFEKWINYQIEEKKYSDATIHKHVKRLREFLNWAYPKLDYKFITYKVIISDEPVFVTEEELDILIKADLSGYLAKTRDLFVFCSTSGMRYSDSQRFLPQWIKGGVIQFRMSKTGGKAVVPLFNITKSILERWNGVPPKISDQKLNSYLKVLFNKLELTRMVEVSSYSGHKLKTELKPLNEIISSHIARKTFITISLMKGIPIQDVMKMVGHSDYKSMKPYLAITQSHLKEVAKRWDI